MSRPVRSWQLTAAVLCLTASLLAEVMPPLATDVRAQLAAGEQQSAAVPTAVSALPVRSRIEPWQILADRLNLQSWKWTAEASAFSLPALAINSTATSSLSQIFHWASDASMFTSPTMVFVSDPGVFALSTIQWDTEVENRVSEVNGWGAQATGLIAQAFAWASDASLFTLPALTFNSTAVIANYTTAPLDLLRVRFDNVSTVSPLGLALQRAIKDPSALASAEELAARAESRAKARKQNTKPREKNK